MTCHLALRRRPLLSFLASTIALFGTVAQAQDSAPQRLVEPGSANKSQAAAPRLRGGPYATPAYRASLPAITAQDKAALRASNAPSNASAKAFQIGVGRTLPQAQQQIALEQITWTPISNDGGYTTLEIQSIGAAALRLAIDPRSLPKGVTLTVYGTAMPELTYGPYTASELAMSNDGGIYWLPAIEGDTVRLELYADSMTRTSKRPLSLPMVSHLVTSVRSTEEKSLQDIGASGACNIDIACRPAWVAAGSSVAKYLITNLQGATGLCTGTLMNSTGSSGTPPAYFLTAHHCVPTQRTASSMHLYWFFQRAACMGTVPTTTTETTGGATLLATVSNNDQTLVRLTAPPPPGAAYAAWTASAVMQGNAIVGLHHPAGDLKKYSGGAMQGFSNFNSASNNNSASHIRVLWSEGTTEGGSSGSGLFNATLELVGTLHGGDAACGVNSQNLPDWYGRFDQAYASLQPWLAPGPGGPPQPPPVTVTDLTSGVSVSGSVALDAIVWYRITSSSSHTSLSVVLNGMNADADLYLFRDSMSATATCISNATITTPETCTVGSPGNTTWYVAVEGYQAANYTVTATLSSASTTPSITPGRDGGGGNINALLLLALGMMLAIRMSSHRAIAWAVIGLAVTGCAGNSSTATSQSTNMTHQIVLPPPTKAELNAPRQTGKGQPLQVGFGRTLSPEQRRVPLARLRWGPLKSTGYLATISVQSPGAKSLRVGAKISNNVPSLQIAFRGTAKVASVVPAATLFSPDPYWSPVIEGDTIWIELRATAPIQDGTLLELPVLSHLQ